MSIDIVVPTLGESVSEATIARWHKKQGEQVKVDEILLELETEKVTLEVNAPCAGVISAVLKNEGDTVLVGEAVGAIDEQSEASPSPESKSIDSKPTAVSSQTSKGGEYNGRVFFSSIG